MKNILTLLILLISLCVKGQNYVDGHVYDVNTDQPLPYVNVSINAGQSGTNTNDEGYYYLSLNDVSHMEIITFSVIGYKTRRFEISDILDMSSIKLEKSELVLDEVIIKSVDGGDLINKAMKKLNENYPTSDYHMVGYFQLSQSIDGAEVQYYDALADIYDVGFDRNSNKKTEISIIKERKTKFLNEKGFNNWLDNPGSNYLNLLLTNNYVKTKGSLLDKKSRYQIDSIFNENSKKIYAVSTFEKPYYLTKDPNNSSFRAQLYVGSDEYNSKIYKIIEEEKIKEGVTLSEIAWKKESAKNVISAITSEKRIIEYREWNGKLYIFRINNDYVITDYNAESQKEIHSNEYRGSFVTNDIYLGKPKDEKEIDNQVQTFWNGYILNNDLNNSQNEKLFEQLNNSDN